MDDDKDITGDQSSKPVKSGPNKSNFRKTTEVLRQGQENHLRHRPSLEWRADSKRVSEPFGDLAAYTGIDRLREILSESRTGKELLEQKTDQALKIFFDPQTPVSQYYPKENIITLNPHNSEAELIVMLSRELRRAWQHQSNLLVNPLQYDPDEAILVNRAQQADALIIAIRIAWELKLTTYPQAWDFLVGSPVSDVTRVYELQARSDFRSLNNGEASRAAYDKWFESDRTKIYDKRVIHEMLLDECGYVFSNNDVSKKLTKELLMQLGDVPNGKNYLALPGYKPPTDMDYAAVMDRSNANFLWFIKFERNFQAKEKELLEQSLTCSAEVVDFSERIRAIQAGSTDEGHIS